MRIRVFLDTNVIFKEGFFRSTLAFAFLKAAHILGIEVVIPEIVLDEAKGNYGRQLAEKINRFSSAHKQLKELINIPDLNISLEEQIKAYEETLETLLTRQGVQILPYPQLNLKEMIAKSYKAEKPFKENGDGHKDFIIWQTILHFITEKKDNAANIFITNNDKDFFEKKGDSLQLFPALSQQFSIPTQVPKIYPSLRDFFEEHISPFLPGLQIYDVAGLSLENIKELAQSIIKNDLLGYSAFGIEGVPFENDVTVTSILDEIDITNVSLKALGNDEILVTLTGEVEIEVDGYIEKHVYHSEREHMDNVYIVDRDHNEWVMYASSTIKTPFELRLTYDTAANQTSNHEIKLLNEISSEF